MAWPASWRSMRISQLRLPPSTSRMYRRSMLMSRGVGEVEGYRDAGEMPSGEKTIPGTASNGVGSGCRGWPVRRTASGWRRRGRCLQSSVSDRKIADSAAARPRASPRQRPAGHGVNWGANCAASARLKHRPAGRAAPAHAAARAPRNRRASDRRAARPRHCRCGEYRFDAAREVGSQSRSIFLTATRSSAVASRTAYRE